MNCQDFVLVLEDGGFDTGDASAPGAVMAHLESCADCHRDRQLHARLIARRVPAMPADLVAGCRALVASAPQASRGRRARSRFYLVGMVARVAAATVMLAVNLWPSAGALNQVKQSEESSTVSIRGAYLPAIGAETEPRQGSDSLDPPGPAFLVFVQPQVEPEGILSSTRDDPFASMREQMRAIEDDPGRKNAMASFRAAFINELTQVPGLGLVDAESQLIAAARSMPAFRLVVGRTFLTSPTGQFVAPDPPYVTVSVNAWRIQPDGKAVRASGGFNASIDLGGGCNAVPAGSAFICGDAHGTAAKLVRQLREGLFPPDPSITRQRQARLLNGALEQAQRYSALEELLGIQQGGAAQAAALRDPATLRGLLDLAAGGDPALRARIWRVIRGVAQPELLGPLQASAASDVDVVRMEAVATLAADFAHDPRGRAALELVAATDGRALIRALAESGLSGAATWRTYLNSSLLDADRSPYERVEALAYQFSLPAHLQPQDSGQTYPFYGLLDDAGVDALARLLPEASYEQPASEGRLVRVANALMPRYRTNAAVTDAMLHFLRHGRATNTRMIAVQALGATRRNEERVLAALRETLRSDPVPEVRDWVRGVMGEGFAATPP